MPLILGANSVSGGYEIDNSLRFNSGSSDYLSKSFASNGNRQTWTWSAWIKISKLTTTPAQYLFTATDATTATAGIYYSEYVGNTLTFENSAISLNLRASANLFRDPSAWYHIVAVLDTTQATSTNRAKLYVNNTLITSYTSLSNYPTQNANGTMNSTGFLHTLSSYNGTAEFFNGYMAETYFIDGQALTPSSFGETDEDTGIWKPKAYTGTYGTNGFYLQFKNSASLGTDSSGNGNNFTVNNLTSIDQTTDTPTNNFATMNAVDNSSVTLSEGNLSASCASPSGCRSTIGVTTGKWYVEVKYQNTTSMCGVVAMEQAVTSQAIGATIFGASGTAPELFLNGSTPANYNSATAFTANDIMQIALDMDSNTVYFGLNGSWFDGTSWNSASPNTGHSLTTGYTYGVRASTGSGTSVNIWNFGNPPFTISSGNADGNGLGNFEYAVPAGYYSLNTKNLAQYG